MLFCTSDLHLGHSNLCLGTSIWLDKSGCRPFQTVEEHDNTIINNINEKVRPNDRLLILGDFCVGSLSSSGMKKYEAYQYYRNRINCEHIIYVRGNHSLSLDELQESNIFEEVYDYYEFKHNRKFVCAFHFPIHSWNNMSKGSYHIFGHEHGKRIYGRSMDVGVDSHNFQPYLLDDVLYFLKQNSILEEGHHKREIGELC